MYTELRSDERESIVKHYCTRASWLAERDRFLEADEAIKLASPRAADQDALLQQVSSARRAVRKVKVGWMKDAKTKITQYLSTAPYDVLQKDIDNIKDLSIKMEGIEQNDMACIVVESTANLIRSNTRRNVFKQSFGVLYNALLILDNHGETRLNKLGHELESKRRKRVKALEHDMGRLLKTDVGGFSENNLSTGETVLQNMQKLLISDDFENYLAHLWDEERFEEKRNVWDDELWKYTTYTDQFKIHKRELELSGLLLETRRRAEELWRAPKLFVEKYQQALDICLSQKKMYPDHSGFSLLNDEAQQHHAAAQAYSDKLLAQATEGNFRPWIDEYTNLKEMGYGFLPGIHKHGESLSWADFRPASQAIVQVEVIAQEFADREASVFEQQAVEMVGVNAEQAGMQIEKALKLSYLSKKKRQELETYRDSTLIEEMERQQDAKRLLEKAQWYQEAEDYEKAWEYVSSALDLSPGFTPTVQMREKLVPWVKIHWGSVLRGAERSWTRNDSETARRQAKQVVEHTRGIREFAQAHEGALSLMESLERHEREEDV